MPTFDFAAMYAPTDPHVGRETGRFFDPDRLTGGDHEGSVAGWVVDVRAYVYS